MERDDAAQALVELQALQRVAEDVISSRDLDQVLERCIDRTREVANTSSGSIYLRDETRDVFTRLITRDTMGDQAHLPIDQIDAALAGRNYFIADLDDPLIAWHPAVGVAKKRGFRITLNMGMRWRGRVTGLLVLAWRERVTIAGSMLATLEALVGYQAAAIENARTLMLLETRARLAQTLREFSGRALTMSDESELEQLILETAVTMAQGDGGVVARRQGNRFVPAVAHNTEKVPEGMPDTEPLIATMLAKAAPLLIEDIAEVPAGSPLAELARIRGYTSLALIPLDVVDGLLVVGVKQRHRWNGEEAEALQTLAQVSSQALERCRVQLAEARERRRLDATLEHLPIGVVVVDAQGRALHTNRAAVALGTLLGTIGERYEDALSRIKQPGERPPPTLGETLVGAALRGELPPPRDIEVIDVHGRRRNIRGVAAPLHEPGQAPVAVLGFSEVTELFELAAAKDRFLRVASHELRSPVTALRATAQLLTLDPSADLDPERRRALHERIDRQTARLVKLVAQLLDSARLSADALPLDLEEMDLGTLARDVADEAGARVRLDCETELRGRWDRSRLEQVLSNLLSNALQYSSPDAPVDLHIRAVGAHALIRVQDRGVGIPPEELPHVFTPFFRAPHSSGRHKSGMGLGLHITSQIVQRHGGIIRVASEPGVGSTFEVELPRQRRDV
jgi:signal transduction histidine kinase